MHQAGPSEEGQSVKALPVASVLCPGARVGEYQHASQIVFSLFIVEMKSFWNSPLSCVLMPPSLHSTYSMSSLLRYQTRSALVQNHMRYLRTFTDISVATKNPNTVSHSVHHFRRSLALRSFHSSLIDHSGCGLGSPSHCPECRQHYWKPICEICSVHLAVHHD